MALREQWIERESAWDRRLAILCCTIMRSAGANVKLEDFLPQHEIQKKNLEDFKDHMATIPGVKRRVN